MTEDAKTRSTPGRPYKLAGLGIVLVAAIAAATWRYDLYAKETVGREVRNELATIADLKVRQISEWRAERMGDAQALVANGMSLRAIRRVVSGEGGGERAQVLAWMQTLCGRLPYANAILADAKGRPVLTAGRKIGSAEHLQRLAVETARRDEATWSDFHRESPLGAVHLGLNIPLRLAPGAPAFGSLLLGIDPADYLYPLLQRWPTPSASGETLLIRRDGADALFLNDLRYRRNAALNLRIPLTQTMVPAVQAISGGKGSVEGPDYRGVPVLAAVYPVPGTPWFLVAKIDAGEVRAPIARRSAWAGVTAASLMLAAAALLGFVWRRQQASFYRERYQAELERRALAGHYDYLSRFANDIILLMDDTGRIVEANDRAVEAYGYSRADLLRKNIRDLRAPSEREELEEQWSRTAQRGSLLFETVHWRSDGGSLPVEVSSHSIEIDGRAFRQSVIRDITERKRTEEERSLLEAQLRQAQKMESVGRLAGGVAHDFNNHLTVIGGYCGMLLAQLPADDPARESIEEIASAGARAADLTRQLLTFSRKQIAESKPISLNEAVADAGGMLRRLIGADVEIVTALDPAPATIMADRGQLNQVLMNLAINARDAMPRGGRLTIETGAAEIDEGYVALHVDARAGSYATLTVSDTGVGMSTETMQKIFEPFFTTKGTGVGTGLGLATVYGIVRQSGGWIRVDSEPGRGATFRAYFPRVNGPAEAAGAPSTVAQDAGGSETVLIVEDQADVRRLAMAILSQKGYRLLEAANGSQALALSANFAERIDLLLTDVVMPGMTGRELAGRLQAARPGVKVLYMSGYTAEAMSRQEVFDAGAAYLPKPFTGPQLTLKIREILGTQ